MAVWNALTKKGAARVVWIASPPWRPSPSCAIQIAGGEGYVLSLLVRLALLGVALLLARYALARDVRSLKQMETPGKPVPAARHGVLIMNLKSGGGKAEKFHLVDECRARGIEPVVLQRGDDLLQLARDAIDRGADVVGMAGGDGSQALVASIAAERGVPMVVIPAGTRNHFALDIGLDRDDVVGALDAYGEARERVIDLADVNGRIFVNNVSLGLYATIVQSPEYRDAKRETTLAALPEMLGPGAEPFDLRFTTPDGVEHEGAHVIQVSNGPYGTTTGGITSRPRLDTGQLGVFSLVVPDAVAATRAIAALTTATPALYEGYLSWATPVFEVTSAAPDRRRPRRGVARDGPAARVLVAAGRAPPAAAAPGDRLLAGRAGHRRQGPARPVARRARASRPHRRSLTRALSPAARPAVRGAAGPRVRGGPRDRARRPSGAARRPNRGRAPRCP